MDVVTDQGQKDASVDRRYSDDDINIIEDGDLQFEQVFSGTWKIPEFKSFFDFYTENSSKDGTEICPIRSYLIETGHQIGIPCKWIANLYIDRFAVDEENNNNLPISENAFCIRLSMKLIEVPTEGTKLITNCRIHIKNLKKTVYTSTFTSIRENGLNEEYELEARVFEMEKFQNLFEMDSPLFVSFDQHLYRSPMKWGLSSGALRLIMNFIETGELHKEDLKYFGREVLCTCNLLGITGILNHFNR